MKGAARAIQLLICAAGKDIMVCGLKPGHQGKHRDVEWPVEWSDPS